jgi:hypothetical protein
VIAAHLFNERTKVALELHRTNCEDEVALGAAMNNVIRFPSRGPEACAICEAWLRGRRERLLIEDILLKGAVCDDCLLAFWEDLMATEPSQRERRP